MSQTSLSKVAGTAHSKLIETIGFSKKSFIIIGKLLFILRRNETYKNAIGECSWTEYIAQPEISLTKGEADRLIQIYEEFVKRLGFSEDEVAEIPIKNIHYLLPIAKSKERGAVEPLFYDAQHLSQKDFRERIYDIKHNTDNRTYSYMVMRKCNETGTLTKVHNISSEEIIEKLNVEQT